MAKVKTEHPIIFSGPMVQAILDDRKTQTRRVIKPQPTDIITPRGGQRLEQVTRVLNGRRCWFMRSEGGIPEGRIGYCRFGEPGHELWVREAWRPYLVVGTPERRGTQGILYRVGMVKKEDCRAGPLFSYNKANQWRPSIHMFRWASRIMLEVTGVRPPERVQEISEEDARAEGVCFRGGFWLGGIHPVKKTLQCWPTPQRAFRATWDSINAKPKPCHDPKLYPGRPVPYYVSYPWEDIQETREHRGRPWYVCGNPHVWPITFKRLAS